MAFSQASAIDDRSTCTPRDEPVAPPFPPIFDILDDASDELEYTDEELNRFFDMSHLHSADVNDEVEEEILTDGNESDAGAGDESDEQVISQKLSQLSTQDVSEYESSSPTTTTTTTGNKRRSTTTSESLITSKKTKRADEQDPVPAYLSPDNATFRRTMKKTIGTTEAINVDELRQVAIFTHHIAALRIQKQIAMAYLQSGTGAWSRSDFDVVPIDRRVWPSQVTSVLPAQRSTTTTRDEQHVACETLVHQRLRDMDEKILNYQRHLDEATSTHRQAIDNYVEQFGIAPLRMKRDLKIALLEYQYHAEINERHYRQANPNPYQTEVAKRLFAAHYELETARGELKQLKLRVFYNRAPSSICSMLLAPSPLNDKAVPEDGWQRAFDQQQKSIQCQRLDAMIPLIVNAEVKFYRCRTIFDAEQTKMNDNHRNLVANKGMSTTLCTLIEQRLQIITDQVHDQYEYTTNYYLRSSFDSPLDTTPQGFLSSTIVDTSQSLNHRQLQLLNRGPSYVPPSMPSVLDDDDAAVKKLYLPLKRQVVHLLNKSHVNIARMMEIEKKIHELFQDCFSLVSSTHLLKRAVDEEKLVRSIRRSLKKNDLVVRRTADQMNTFYVTDAFAFDCKADEFLMKTDAYKRLLDLDEHNGDGRHWSDEIKEMIESMNAALETLKTKKALPADVIQTLLTNPAKVQLPRLCFLPDISHKDQELSLTVHIAAQRSTTWKIANYVQRLLQPLVDKILRSSTFRNEADFIKKLHYYTYTRNNVKPTTLFCTVHITNFYTVASHDSMIATVGYFLQDNLATNKLEHVSIATIQNLLQLYLYNNIFLYNSTIYTIARGGPNTLPLSDTLSNIWLFGWQKSLSSEVQRFDEMFGRYKDRIFFTWNHSASELRALLQKITLEHPNVHLETSMGSGVHFWGAHIEHQRGQLFTRMHQEQSSQRYALPYVVGHSKVKHSLWFRSALLRAAYYCSALEDFQRECTRLELTLLTNGYSLQFVERHIVHFFAHLKTNRLPYHWDQAKHHSFRAHCFDLIKEHHKREDDLVKLDRDGRLFRFHYLYVHGPRCLFNRQYRQLWCEYFKDHPILSGNASKMLLTTHHQHSLNALLVRAESLPPMAQQM